MASSATPLHDSLIELAIPDAHAHAIKWYLNDVKFIILLDLLIFHEHSIFYNNYVNINFFAGEGLHYRESIESVGGDFYP